MITYLVDASAYWAILREEDTRKRWVDDIETGAIGICDPTRAEILYSGINAADLQRRESRLDALFGAIGVPKNAWRWVNAAQHRLALKGQHRSAGPIDLLVCATAVHHGLTVLHRDADFEAVARVVDELRHHRL